VPLRARFETAVPFSVSSPVPFAIGEFTPVFEILSVRWRSTVPSAFKVSQSDLLLSCQLPSFVLFAASTNLKILLPLSSLLIRVPSSFLRKSFSDRRPSVAERRAGILSFFHHPLIFSSYPGRAQSTFFLCTMFSSTDTPFVSPWLVCLARSETPYCSCSSRYLAASDLQSYITLYLVRCFHFRFGFSPSSACTFSNH